MSGGLFWTLVLLGFGVLVYRNLARQSAFVSRYRYSGEFDGRGYDCTVHWSRSGEGKLYFVAADAEALYLLAPERGRGAQPQLPMRDALSPESPRKERRPPPLFVMPPPPEFRIPWGELAVSQRRVRLRKVMWFDLPQQRRNFHLPHREGLRLLADAGVQWAIDEVDQSQGW